jgi:exodeoxyribonuclease VII small subunit
VTASRSHKRRASPAAGSEDRELPFERALERLEEIVDQLEQGDLELESALDVFEEGVQLTKRCASQLDSAERRIEVLMEEAGKTVARPFDLDGSERGGEPEDED